MGKSCMNSLIRYFKSIQARVDDDVEEVVVESNGDWHTPDGKFGSEDWLKANGQEPEVKPPIRSPSPVKVKRKAVMVLSSDDEDSPSSKRASTRPASVRPPTRPGSALPATDGVIDLTLSDDDDDEPPRAGPSRLTVQSPPIQSPPSGAPTLPPIPNMKPLRTDSWPAEPRTPPLNYQLDRFRDRDYSDDDW